MKDEQAKIDISHLNPEQKSAVLHGDGPLLIIAGAGTGKTGVITHRIAYLIAQKMARPEEILALTFTEKAAAEMEERVDELVPYGFVDTWILTFHAFGDRIIRENALDLGLPANIKVLTRPEQVVFVQDNLMAFDLKYYMPLSNPTRHIEALITQFSRLKDEMVVPDAYVRLCEEKLEKISSDEGQEWEKQLEVAKAYQRYQELMEQNGYLDFGDQINICLKLFKEHPNVLKKYREQFKYVLVDEFQDTNYAQNELVKVLAGPTGNITVVGDDDQSIYRFRGAAISNILYFKESFPGAKEIVLTQNYRSTQAVLDAAYRLVNHNNPDRLEVRYQINKRLKAQKQGPIPTHYHCDTLSSEADKVASVIKEKFLTGNYKLNDFAILVRKKSAADDFMRSLNYHGLPFKFDGSSGLYDRPEVRLLINFIKGVVDAHNSLAVYHLASSEVYNFNLSDLIALNTYASRHNRSLEWAMRKTGETEELKDSVLNTSEEKIEAFLGDLEKYREMSRKDSAGQLMYAFLKESGYLTKLLEEADPAHKAEADEASMRIIESQVKISNIAKFFEKVTAFEGISSDKSLVNFKLHLEALMEAGDDPSTAEIDPDLEAVNILTAHKSKGLEFKVVFVVNCINGYYPSVRRSDPIEIPADLLKETLPEGEERTVHVQEERRLFYVAMTRARDELYFTSAEDYGGQRSRKISQFVMEALDLPEVDVAKYKLSDVEKIKRFDRPQQEILALPKKFYVEGKLALNAHQIDDYLSCPKKFEFIHILKVPIRAHYAVMYGSAMHMAIEDYFARKMAGFPVALEDMWRILESSWGSEGFVTREHEEERFQKGKQALASFFSREEVLNRLPAKLEESFVFNLADLDVKIKGRYDAIFEDGETVEIRDFKTSDVEDKKKADDKAKKNRQLSIYALAYLNTKGKIPEKLTLDFVDKGFLGESVRTEKDLNKVVEEIRTVAEGIKGGCYTANPGFGECGWCAYREICPFTLTDV